MGLEEVARSMRETLVRMERRMDEGFNRLDMRIDRLDGKINTQFLWLITFIGGFTGLFALVAHGLRWF